MFISNLYNINVITNMISNFLNYNTAPLGNITFDITVLTFDSTSIDWSQV